MSKLLYANSGAMNIGERVSFQIMDFSRYMSRSGIAGSYARKIHLGYHLRVSSDFV